MCSILFFNFFFGSCDNNDEPNPLNLVGRWSPTHFYHGDLYDWQRGYDYWETWYEYGEFGDIVFDKYGNVTWFDDGQYSGKYQWSYNTIYIDGYYFCYDCYEDHDFAEEWLILEFTGSYLTLQLSDDIFKFKRM